MWGNIEGCVYGLAWDMDEICVGCIYVFWGEYGLHIGEVHQGCVCEGLYGTWMGCLRGVFTGLYT